MTRNWFKIVCAVNALIIKDNQILLGLRQNTGWGDGCYNFPGGHIDGKEWPTKAICRELKEEIGIEVNPINVKFENMIYYIRPDHERIQLLMKINSWSGQIENMELDKCIKLEWFGLDKLPKNLTDYCKTALTMYVNKTQYFEVSDLTE